MLWNLVLLVTRFTFTHLKHELLPFLRSLLTDSYPLIPDALTFRDMYPRTQGDLPMYQVEKSEYRAGKETIVVTNQGKRVSSASVNFVRWMHDYAPRTQLRPEQAAMVEWYGKEVA